jgi:peptidoglycan/LPS O-acetylase OafA/YrhL
VGDLGKRQGNGSALIECAEPLHPTGCETVNATAPTSTSEPAGELLPSAQYVRRPALPALTGLRTLLALTILLFHFTPDGLTWARHPSVTLYPIINIGYVFVSFFFLISGFILSYNYAGRPQPMNAVDFWMARLSRLYPVYALTMLISIPMLLREWAARPHAQFYEGVIATPLLMQGFFPRLATFWNTVSWTLSCEVMLYLAFPWLLKLRWPKSVGKLVLVLLLFWVVGLIPHSIYVMHDFDHLGHAADRYSDGIWINTLKYTPLPYVCTFLAGLTLGRLHEAAKLGVRGRMVVGLLGFAAAWFAVYHLTERLPYILIHGGLLTPIFAVIILGLAGTSPLARVFSARPLVTIGASTYALYLLHFNLFLLLQWNHVWARLGLARLDPWISYVFVVLVALGVRKWVEHPCQVAIGGWWKRKRAAQKVRPRIAVG